MRYRKSTIAVVVLTLSVTAAVVGLSSLELQKKGEVAIVQLEGTITPSTTSFQDSSVSPGDVRDLVDRSKGTDAVIFEWNSGGGAVVASKEVKRTIEDVERPTICRFRDLAASGAYLASLGCDRIVADSASVTGSIGVKSSYLEFSGLLEKLGVEYVNVSSGKYKERTSRFQNASGEDIEYLKQRAGEIHEQFLETVRTERNLSEESMQKIETGTVLLGSEAKEIGLVDSLGGREKAVSVAENLTEKELTTSKVETPSGISFLSLLSSSVSVKDFLGTESLLKASVL